MNTPDRISKRRDRQIDTAVRIVEAVAEEVRRGMPADSTLSRIFREHREFGSRDRRFYAHPVYAHFRWLGWTRRIAPDDIRRSCAWAVMLDASTTPETGDAWREIIGLSADEAFALRSAVLPDKPDLLRRLLETHEPALSGHNPLMLADLVPEWVASCLSDETQLAAFVSSCQSRPPTWLRVPESDIASFRIMLTAQAVQHREHRQLPGAFAIDMPFNLLHLERAFGKPIQVQDIASQAVGSICRAGPGSTWWDACSGAGGKTLLLSEAVGAAGRVLATDVRSTVLDNLARRVSAMSFSNVDTSVLDASLAIPTPDLFDGVLIDAPCSGLGTWPRNPDARWRTSHETIPAMAERQLNLLGNASNAVRENGVLVYSVCSITRAESADVIRAFMRGHPHFRFDEFPHPLTGAPANGEITIQPEDGPGDGMYVARLRRVNRS